MPTPIQSIGVIGGGSAGYMSALYLKKLLPQVSVTLIESSKIPVINVGEATTPLILNFLHHRLGIPVDEFFRETRPTLKLGVKFVWGKPGAHYYNNPFGPSDIYSSMFHTGHTNAASVVSLLMDAKKVPFIRTADGGLKLLHIPKGYAYHIDNQHFLRFMKQRLLTSGCTYLDTEINDVRTGPNGIESITDAQQNTHTFDLLFDCSGFRSLLLEQNLGTPWVPYSSSLLTNRAIVGTRPNPEEISPYTTATTLDHGWLWNTPMQHEDHLGYVFAKEFCSDDEAFAELKKYVKTINHERIVNFRTGRHEKSWAGNVIALGNSFAFIEPLESTGLHMILRQLRQIGKILQAPEITPAAIATYNETTNKTWDNLRWFIALHFKFNARTETPFWRTCRKEADVTGIAEYLEFYKANGPASRHPDSEVCQTFGADEIFSAFAFDSNLAGCGVNEQFFRDHPSEVDPQWPARHKADQALTQRAIGMREAIAYMESNPCDFTPSLGVLNYAS